MVPTSDFAGATISVSGGDPCLFDEGDSEDPPGDLGDTVDQTLEVVDELLLLNEPVVGEVLLSVESTADGTIAGTSSAPADPMTGEWSGEVTVSEDASPGLYLVRADCTFPDAPEIPSFSVGQATFEVLVEEPPEPPGPGPNPPGTPPFGPGPQQPPVEEPPAEEPPAEEPPAVAEEAPAEEPPGEPTPPATPVNGEPDDMTG